MKSVCCKKELIKRFYCGSCKKKQNVENVLKNKTMKRYIVKIEGSKFEIDASSEEEARERIEIDWNKVSIVEKKKTFIGTVFGYNFFVEGADEEDVKKIYKYLKKEEMAARNCTGCRGRKGCIRWFDIE